MADGVKRRSQQRCSVEREDGGRDEKLLIHDRKPGPCLGRGIKRQHVTYVAAWVNMIRPAARSML
jgi:hypothetical protein